MAGSVNKVILVGNLGRDPEIRTTNDGTKVANLSLATSESWRDRNTGERRERTEWHRVVIFNDRLVDVVEKYVSKGSKLYIEGQLQMGDEVVDGGPHRAQGCGMDGDDQLRTGHLTAAMVPVVHLQGLVQPLGLLAAEQLDSQLGLRLAHHRASCL